MRIDQLTFTRFLAAIAIVIYHKGLEIFPFSQDSISFLFTHANIGVSYFFVLSGFVMMLAYGKKTRIASAEYYKKRFARIYPVYLLAILLIAMYIALFFDQKVFSGMLSNILLIQAWIPPQALLFNPPGWTLSVEFFFYLLFPFLFNTFYTKRSLKTVACGSVAFFVLSQLVFFFLLQFVYSGHLSIWHNFIFYFPLLHLSEFALGSFAGLFFMQNLKEKQKNYDWAVLACIAIFILVLNFSPSSNWFHNGLLGIIFIPFLILLSLNTGKITQLFKQKFLVFLGEISYGVYILQIPLFLWSRGVLKSIGIEQQALVFWLSCVALIIGAGLSYVYIEQPLRKYIRNNSFSKIKYFLHLK